MAYSRKSKATAEERRARTEAASKELRETVVDELVKSMERDGPEWVKEWSGGSGSPRNPFTGTVYRGANAWALMAQMKIRGYKDPRFCTFNNARDMGWHVRRGEHGCAVEYWKPYTFDDNKDPDNPDREGHIHSRWSLVSVTKVFNFEQIEGAPELEAPEPVPDHELYQVADMLKESSRCRIFEEPSDRAYFSPARDEVHVPERGQFSRPEAFVSTLLHEMAHSTGIPNDRKLVGYVFDQDSYAREELIAELSATLSSAMLGIGYDYADGLDKSTQEYQNHVAYLKHWAGHLRENPDVLFKCSNDAQKATDFLIERYDEVAEAHGTARPDPDRQLKEQYEKRQAEKEQEGRPNTSGRGGKVVHAPVSGLETPTSAPSPNQPRTCLESLRNIAEAGPTQEGVDALAALYAEQMSALAERACTGPACWGEQVSLGDGRCVSIEAFTDALGFTPTSEEGRALAATGYALDAFTRDREPMAGLVESASRQGGVSAWAATIPQEKLPVLHTVIEPAMYGEDALRDLADMRPDLFDGAARERYPEAERAARAADADHGRVRASEGRTRSEQPAARPVRREKAGRDR